MIISLYLQICSGLLILWKDKISLTCIWCFLYSSSMLILSILLLPFLDKHFRGKSINSFITHFLYSMFPISRFFLSTKNVQNVLFLSPFLFSFVSLDVDRYRYRYRYTDTYEIYYMHMYICIGRQLLIYLMSKHNAALTSFFTYLAFLLNASLSTHLLWSVRIRHATLTNMLKCVQLQLTAKL